MARKFLPALRGMRTPEPAPVVVQETKSLTVSGYTSTTNYGTPGTMLYGSEGRADAWDMDAVISEGYERDVWVFRCVELVSQHAARLPFLAGKNIGSDHEERLESHALYRVMNKRANPLEKAYHFRKRLSAQLLLSKRGVFVEVLKSKAGNIVRLDLLDPSRVRPVPDPGGDYIMYFEYTRRDGHVREIPPSRIRWIREPHPTDPFSGVTPLEAAGMSIELDFLSRLYNNSFIKNDSRPGGVLGVDTDSLTDQEMDRLERKFTPGAQHAGELTVVGTGPGGLKYIDTTTKPRDMAYEHASSNSKNEILSAFGIGESLLGNAAGRTYDNAESELYSFWTTVMPPHLSLIASAFDEDIPEEWDPFFDVSGIEVLELPRRRDREEARNEVSAGLRTIDEYRPIANLKPLDVPQTRALWVSPSKAPIPGRPEDAAALGLGPGGEEGGMGGPQVGPDGAPMPPEGGGGSAVDAVAEARAAADGAAEAVSGAAAALDEARGGDSGAPVEGGAAAAVDEASADYSGTAPGDAADAVRDARRMMQRKSLPGGRVGFDLDPKSVDELTMSVKAALDALLARQQGVITARLESPKTRKGTKFWTPDSPTDTRGGDEPLDVPKVIDVDRWERETFETIAPLTSQASIQAASDMRGELEDAGMIVGTVDSVGTPWQAPAMAGAHEAGEAVGGLLDEVSDTVGTVSASTDSIEDVTDAVRAVYARRAPQIAHDIAHRVGSGVIDGAQEATMLTLAPAPGHTAAPARVGSMWVLNEDARFIAPSL